MNNKCLSYALLFNNKLSCLLSYKRNAFKDYIYPLLLRIISKIENYLEFTTQNFGGASM